MSSFHAEQLSGTSELSQSLKSLKIKLEDLLNSISQIKIQIGEPKSQLLDRFALIANQYQSFNKALDPILLHFVVQPESFPENFDPSMIPELLRTKTLPEIEKTDQDIIDETRRRKISTPKGQFAIQDPDETPSAELNKACDELISTFQNQKKLRFSKFENPPPQSSEKELEEFMYKIISGKGLRADPPPPVPTPTPQDTTISYTEPRKLQPAQILPNNSQLTQRKVVHGMSYGVTPTSGSQPSYQVRTQPFLGKPMASPHQVVSPSPVPPQTGKPSYYYQNVGGTMSGLVTGVSGNMPPNTMPPNPIDPKLFQGKR